MSRGFIASALALIFVFVSVGCDQGQPVTVWADPALKTALDEIAPRFRREHRAGLEAEYKESVALKEADETEYWLNLLRDGGFITNAQAESLLADCLELQKMLTSSIKTAKTNLSNKLENAS